MASLTINRYFEKIWKENYKFYRLFYNLLALLTLLFPLHYSRHFNSPLLFSWQSYFILIQTSLLFLAILLFYLGAKQYDIKQFLGLRQLKSGNSHFVLSKEGGVHVSGILSLTRHPWYLASLILIWSYSTEVHLATLITNVILTFYLYIGATLEERKILFEFGEEYQNYQQKVSMLLPLKWVTSKLKF